MNDMHSHPEKRSQVTDYENDGVKRAALAAKCIFDVGQEKIAKPRQQPQDYQESLPKDPKEALKEIRSILTHMSDNLSEQYARTEGGVDHHQ
ncbi:MAG: hypothetical protein AAF714_11675 [Pseudomonadota bacterium]